MKKFWILVIILLIICVVYLSIGYCMLKNIINLQKQVNELKFEKEYLEFVEEDNLKQQM